MSASPTSNQARAVNFLQSGTATPRTAQNKMREIFSVLDFLPAGYVLDGSVDYSTQIQNAVNAAQDNGGLYFPQGTYLIGTQIDVTGSIKIYGDGNQASYIKLNSATMLGFDVASASGFSMEDMSFTSSLTHTAGCYVRIGGTGGGENTRARFRNVSFLNGWQGIRTISANYAVIDGCTFNTFLDAGIVISNSVNGDSGDNLITGCQFSAAAAGTDSIRHTSGGGLIVSQCKFNGSATGYHMEWDSATSSTQITLVGNHFEPMTEGTIIFERASGAATVADIQIAYNRFNNTATVPAIWFKTNNSGVFARISLAGNVYHVGETGTAIQIDGGALFSIIGELIQGSSATSVGIATGNATATTIYIDESTRFFQVNTELSINDAANQLARSSPTFAAITASGLATLSGQIQASNGSAGAPAYAFINATNNGLYHVASTAFDLSVGGTARLRFSTTGTELASDQPLAWTSGAIGATSRDVILERAAADVLGTPDTFLLHSGTAIPAGGTAGAGLRFSSTSNFGVFFGSGAPTLAAAKGSLYLRSDGSGTTDRAYINTNGSTTWTALTTVA